MTRSEARTETSRQLSNTRETLKLAKSQGAKTRAVNKIDYLVAVQKALCEPTREMVERMRGKWTDVYMSSPSSFTGACSVCRTANDIPPPVQAHFCPTCGAPMTDEAVDILWQKLKEVLDNE